MSSPGPDRGERAAAAIATVLAYHRLSSLDPHRPAAAPAKLDRGSEPNPFRRYEGAPLLPLPLPLPLPEAAAAPGLSAAAGGPAALPGDLAGLGRFLGDAVGLTGWKRSGEAAFGLRAVPSAGNLHPTEIYLLTSGGGGGPGPGLHHYSSFDHALEWRRETAPARPGLHIGLATIYWRSAWKYGERAFRLAHLDAGHVAAALAASAALGGFRLRPAAIGDGELESLLGLSGAADPEAERGVLLLAAEPGGEETNLGFGAAAPLFDSADAGPLRGEGSPVSLRHRKTPGIEQVHRATRVPPPPPGDTLRPALAEACRAAPWPPEVLRRRRSRHRFDTGASLSLVALRALLRAVSGSAPFLFPWRAEIELLLFVHRVEGLRQGLYLLAAAGGPPELFRAALRRDLAFEPAADLEDGCRLLLLAAGDARASAAALAGGQAAAGDGAFTAVLVGRFRSLMEEAGASVYRALHWQAGEIGHRLCLAAEAAGLGATGLSGFHDDRLAELLGLRRDSFRPLYLVAAGHPAGADAALEPPYLHRGTNASPLPPSRGGYG